MASLLAACAAPSAKVLSAGSTAACVLDASPELIPVPEPIAGELNVLFELPDSPEWWAPAPMDSERTQYRAALVGRLGGEDALQPRALLQRQRAVHASLPGDRAREAENIDALLQGRAGTISPASCLEWRLFQHQAHRFPAIDRPTEFGAYVLRGQGRIRVYFSGADRVGQKLRHEVSDRVVADVARGFTPLAHLHNHPFLFDRKPGDRTWATADTLADIAGALAPSLTDVQAYRQMREGFGLQGAWVTNGLDSAHYSAEDLDRLSAWP
ncbi:hypothetical protein [Hyalangium versicolor]|uniref:hypothetical protein n=1 Tax=Hyalangium versicolor TaxID=2861190 RepID=UPI001CCDC000|nr:hypothetical protein [Hyalangium versicolor]